MSERRVWKLDRWHMDVNTGAQIPVFDPPLEITGLKQTFVEIKPGEKIFSREEIEKLLWKKRTRLEDYWGLDQNDFDDFLKELFGSEAERG